MEDESHSSGGSKEGEATRKFKGVVGAAITIGASLFVVFLFLYLLGALNTATYYMDESTFLPIAVGIMLAFTFIYYPLKKGIKTLPWYDIILILVSLAGTVYIAVYALDIVQYRVEPNLPEMFLGTALVLAVFEAARRTVGLPLAIIAIVLILYTQFTDYMPGIFWGPSFTWPRLLGEIWFFQEGLFGSLARTFFKFIFLFIMFGAMLNFSGAGKVFMALAMGLAGRYRGGPAKVAVVASALLGTMTGSAISNVATIGVITIPMMKSIGYKPHYAGAIESVASTGGQIMPPVMGIAAFVMADFMGVPYINLAIAAIFPALLYYVTLFIQVHVQAVKMELKGLPREQLPSAWKALLHGGHYLLPLLVLLYFMAILRYSAMTSAMYAIATTLIVAMLKKESRWNLKTLAKAVETSVRQSANLLPVIGCSGIITAALTVTGLAQGLSGMLITLGGGNTFILLLLTAAACYVLGLALPGVVAYILLSVLTVPALIQMGINLYAAHMFVFYYATSGVITPPVATAAFVAANIAGAGMMRTGFQAMFLGIVVYIVPFAFVYTPSLLLQGPMSEIPIVIAWCLVGATAMAIALEGYLGGKIGWLQRILLFAGGLTLFAPFTTVKIIATVILVLTVLPQLLTFIKAKVAAPKAKSTI